MNKWDIIKSEINLVAFIERYGYAVDPLDSSAVDPHTVSWEKSEADKSQYTWILRNGPRDANLPHKTDHKIGVSLSCGRWLYSDNRENGHGKGSIIDWIIAHEENVQTAGQALFFLEKNGFVKKENSNQPIKKDDKFYDKDLSIEEHLKRNTRIATKNKYLIETRGIKEETLLHKRFHGKVLEDRRTNAVFVHEGPNGITGYSLKNVKYEAFSTGGKRQIWTSNYFDDDDTLVVTESAIDAICYFQYHKEQNHKDVDKKRFISIEGRLTNEQTKLLYQEFKNVKHIILAFDADKAGSEYEEKILNAGKNQYNISRENPPFGLKDFGEVFEFSEND